jgi:hypothetical protein
MARHKNENWSLNDRINSCDEASIAILMDIRDELQALNAKLSCFRVAKALDAIHAMHKTGVKIRKPRKMKKAGA